VFVAGKSERSEEGEENKEIVGEKRRK